MTKSKIEWTNRTWNPVTGCTKASAGCLHCYAEVMARRLKGMGKSHYANGFKITVHEDSLSEPYLWKRPQMVFVCSMGDLFHEDVDFSFIDKVMKTISDTPTSTYQILTKRAERMNAYFKMHEIPDNVWLGVTVENKQSEYRIDYLRDLPSKVRFLSCEPLLEDLGNINLEKINWLIAGGESGPQARPMNYEWVSSLYKNAKTLNIPFFFKQWGTWGMDHIKRNKITNGKYLDGKIVQEMPII